MDYHYFDKLVNSKPRKKEQIKIGFGFENFTSIVSLYAL